MFNQATPDNTKLKHLDFHFLFFTLQLVHSLYELVEHKLCVYRTRASLWVELA